MGDLDAARTKQASIITEAIRIKGKINDKWFNKSRGYWKWKGMGGAICLNGALCPDSLSRVKLIYFKGAQHVMCQVREQVTFDQPNNVYVTAKSLAEGMGVDWPTERSKIRTGTVDYIRRNGHTVVREIDWEEISLPSTHDMQHHWCRECKGRTASKMAYLCHDCPHENWRDEVNADMIYGDFKVTHSKTECIAIKDMGTWIGSIPVEKYPPAVQENIELYHDCVWYAMFSCQ